MDSFIPLHEPAPVTRAPTRALLIAVAHAGNRLVAGGEHGVIIYSDDNGAIWTQASVPASVPVTAIAFASPQDGWAAGGYGLVLHTTDGGATWQSQIDGSGVNQLMQQAATQYAAANPSAPAAALAVRRAAIFMAAGPDKPFLTILALSPQRAIVLGGYRMCIRTGNGGKDWADCSLNVQDPISHNVYDATSTAGGLYAVGEAGDVFQADANGDVFQAINSPGPGTLFNILQTQSGALLAFGVADGMFRSTDGGKDWTPVAVPGGSDLTSGALLDHGTILVASENGALYASGDDGQSFAVLPYNPGMAVFALTEAGNGNVVLAGSAGVRVVTRTTLELGK